MVVSAKQTNTIGGTSVSLQSNKTVQRNNDNTYDIDSENDDATSNWEEVYDKVINDLKKKYPPNEFDAILKAVKRERDEVIDIMDQNDHDEDISEIMHRVRQKTLQIKQLVQEQYSKEKENETEKSDE